MLGCAIPFLVVLGGCYVSGGLGYAGGDEATAHLAMGLELEVDESFSVSAGACAAVGPGKTDEGYAVPGPVTLGTQVPWTTRGLHQLVGVYEVGLPFLGSWTDDGDPGRVGRGYAGIGYGYELRDKSIVEGRVRKSGNLVATLGPETFWVRSRDGDSTRFGAALDIRFSVRGWTIIETLFEDDDSL